MFKQNKLIQSILLLLLVATTLPVFADNDTRLILQEIRQLRVDMNQLKADTNQLRSDMNERFQQIDRRFEQVDKRFEFLQQLIYILMGLIFTSPLLIFYLKEKSQGKLQAVIFALKETAQDDPRLSKALKIAGL